MRGREHASPIADWRPLRRVLMQGVGTFEHHSDRVGLRRRSVGVVRRFEVLEGLTGVFDRILGIEQLHERKLVRTPSTR